MQVPGDYARLCFDSDADWGYPPLVTVGGNPVWRQTNASRYVRLFQSRRSLLVWKIFGQRLDGWSNADHPTETVPGDPNTLPPGAQINEADLDFTESISHPLGIGLPSLSIDQKMTIARWIDLGCPINAGEGTPNEDFGWFVDDVRPTLAVSLPRPGNNPLVSVIRFGLADAYTGVDLFTLSVKANITIAGRPPGAELADLTQPAGDGIYTIVLSTPIDNAAKVKLDIEVADVQGNITRVARTFSVLSNHAYLPVVVK